MIGELLDEDIHYCLRFIPVDLRKLVIEHKLMIAGGFVRAIVGREEVSDIDIFGPSVATLRDVAGRLADKWGVSAKETKNAITVAAPGRKPVQFITRWLYTDAQQIIHSFDFTIAQACIFPTGADASLTWQGICSARFYADLCAKRLTYTQPERNEDAGGSMMRLVKFLGRGYRIAPASLGMVMARMAERVRWDHPLASDEMGKARILTGLLRQVDPLLAIDGVEIADDELVKISEIREALHETRFRDDEPILDR